MLSVAAAALGLASGGAAFVLIRLIGLITNLALLHRVSWSIPSLAHLRPSPNLVIVAVLGGLAVSVMAHWAPLIRGHGIPEAMEAVLSNQSRIAPRTALAKPISAAIAIGTGGPFGAEGPIIVTGGALGSLIGQLLPVSAAERKILLACGAAGGMAATFGTPLASVVLAIELLLFEFSARAFVPLVVSTSLAAGVHSALFGTGPLFAVPAQNYAGLDKLPLYAALGLACGLLAVVINEGFFLVEHGFRRLPVGVFWHPIIGAVGFAAVGLIVPRALGVGYDEISAVLAGKLAAGTVAALVLAKLVAWWVSLASGTSGGTLAPLLLISGGFGSLLGAAVDHLWPAAHVSPGAFALVAMAAAFGASIRATFTAIVFLFELTRDYQIILPLMLASVLAEFVAGALARESLMTEKLSRRGLRVQGDYEADVLSSTLVADVMTRRVTTVAADATVAAARQLLEGAEHDALPVVDADEHCVAIVARADLLSPNMAPDDGILNAAAQELVTVAPDDTLLEALHLILEDGVTHLPVLDDGTLVGICTRTDILRARLHQFEAEHRQPGWAPLRRVLIGRRRQRQQLPAPPTTAARQLLLVSVSPELSQPVLQAMRVRSDTGPCRFRVVVPRPATRRARRGLPTTDELHDMERTLAARGLNATIEFGPNDPIEAIAAGLRSGPVDEIMIGNRVAESIANGRPVADNAQKRFGVATVVLPPAQ